MTVLQTVTVTKVKDGTVLAKPLRMTFWSPVKETNMTITVTAVGDGTTRHTTEMKWKLGKEKKSESFTWDNLDDAMNDAYGQMRIWATP